MSDESCKIKAVKQQLHIVGNKCCRLSKSLAIFTKSMFGDNNRSSIGEKNTSLTIKHEGGSMMLRGCVAVSGTGNIRKISANSQSKCDSQ